MYVGGCLRSSHQPTPGGPQRGGRGSRVTTYHTHTSASLRGFCVHFTAPDGRIAGLAGIEDDGKVWMLTTPAILDFPVAFAREAKRFIDSRTERVLWNYVDKRNTVHIKLLNS